MKYIPHPDICCFVWPDVPSVKCPADSPVRAADTEWGQRQARPAVAPAGERRAQRWIPASHCICWSRVMIWHASRGQREDRWHWTLGSVTTSLPGPGPRAFIQLVMTLVPLSACQQAMRRIRSPEKTVYGDGRLR
ncbi:hypothetical protein PBY51_021889 [Eleginops maclovinus]|uniref:Uncharacterized protein n=1 Tax=Eleginops maclovinus TaxID=56733 RepID=A0AAN7XIT5_ELEMC|nr:hypothetical protein PBY51_021889 [Eleginops maclovinus]